MRRESNLPPPPSGAVPPPGDPTDGEGRRGGATVRVRTVRDSPSPPSREGAEKSRRIERTRARAPLPVAPLRQRSPNGGTGPGGGGGGGARFFRRGTEVMVSLQFRLRMRNTSQGEEVTVPFSNFLRKQVF